MGTSSQFPALKPVSLNFGTAFAGQTVRLRFRLGSDDNTGGPGWFIDNMSAQGIDNTPFSGVVPDGAVCNGVPVANAGPDQVVTADSHCGAGVTLNGSGSDPEGDPLTFVWSGPFGSASGASVTVSLAAGGPRSDCSGC